MKKILSIVLALTMILALSVTAFADSTHGPEENTYTTSTDDITINATYTTKADETVNVYKVTVAWTAPSFSYEYDGHTYTWNTTEMKYDESTLAGAGWASDSGTLALTVTNYSDKAVLCRAALTDNDTDAVTVSFAEKTDVEAAAAVTIEAGKTAADYTDVNSGTATTADLGGTVTVSGTPTESVTQLATVTVTVRAA